MRALVLLLLGGCDALFRIDSFQHIDAAAGSADAAGSDGSTGFLCQVGLPIPGLAMGDTDPDQRADEREMWFVRTVMGQFTIHVSTRASTQVPYPPPIIAAFNNPGHQNQDPGLTNDALHVFYLSDLNGSRQPFETSRLQATDPFPGGATYYTVPVTPEGIAPGFDDLTLYFNAYDGTLYQGGRTNGSAGFSWKIAGTNIWFPSVTGNGLSVFYHHEPEDSGIYRQTRVKTIEMFGNETRVLTTGVNPQISADGMVLVYEDNQQLLRATCGSTD